MRVFYIITNHEKDPDLIYTKQIRSYLEEHDCRCYMQQRAETGAGSAKGRAERAVCGAYAKESGRGGEGSRADSSSLAVRGEGTESPRPAVRGEGTEQESRENGNWRYTNASRIPSDVECVLVLGGDGTLLQAARDLIDTRLPLLGVNLGTLGFLAEIDIGHVTTALDLLMEDRFSIDHRMLLSGTLYRQGKQVIQDIALNDVTLFRSGKLRVIDFNVYVNDAFLCSYRADGVILATPTGSTGYSLSAGGPIVSPDASLMLLTPVCAHTLTSRPVVLPDGVEVGVEIAGSHDGRDSLGADITFDGDTTLHVGAGDVLRIVKSDRQIHLIKVNNTSFVELLRKKMN